MKFLKIGKYLIAFALLFAIAVTAVSVAATSDDTAVPPDNTSVGNMENTEMISEDLPVNMDESGNTYIELDKVNITFNMDTELTVENVMKAVAAKAEEITSHYDLIKFSVDTDEERSYEYILTFRLNLIGYGVMDCELECPADGVELSAPQGYHKEIIRRVYHYTINTKDNPDRHDDIRYLVFLYLLMREYSDCTIIDKVWFDDSTNLDCKGQLFLCPEYREYGYDNITDYFLGLAEGKAPEPQNAYVIDCSEKGVSKITDKYCENKWFNKETTSIYEDIFGK